MPVEVKGRYYLSDLNSLSPAPTEIYNGKPSVNNNDTMVFNGNNTRLVEIQDDDASFSENNDPNQTLVSGVTVNGTSYPAGQPIGYLYDIDLKDMATGNTYKLIGVHMGITSDSIQQIDAFIWADGVLPPANVALKVTGTHNDSEPYANMTSVPCLTRGTMITTSRGAAAVEELRVGDLVLTRDNDYQAIRWIGSRKLSVAELAQVPKLRPIRIKAGAIGADSPSVDLIVSPQHRILVCSNIAHRMFGSDEVLVAAKHLCQIKGIDVAEDIAEVEYFHILFDRHEVVFSNGAATESLYLGQEALKSIGPVACEELFSLFPELRDLGPEASPDAIRVLPKGRRSLKLVERHDKNSQMLVG